VTTRRYTIHPPQLVGRLSPPLPGEDPSVSFRRLLGEWDAAMQELQRFLRYAMDANDSGQTGGGIVGVVSGTVDHGSIGGLADDDHPQYLKEKAYGGLAAETPEHTHAGLAQGGFVGHSSLTGLSGSDHPHYGTRTIGVGLEGAAVVSGIAGYVRVPFAGTIVRWTVLSDDVRSVVFDVWRAPYADFPPTVGDSLIGAGNRPTLAAASAATAAVSGWTSVALAAGDVVMFNVDSISGVSRVTLWLDVQV